MKVIVFGATGMIGQGVVHACLGHPDVEALLIVGRTPSGVVHEKVKELVHADLFDYSTVETVLSGWDACLFCLGVSSGGMSEAEYTRVTHDLTLAAAKTLLRLNPNMTFEYISGASSDSTEKGSTMWARVKGKTENDLLALGFRRAYMVRPGYIQPIGGIKSKTRSYRILYALAGPLYFLWKLFPSVVTSSDRLGLAMITVARDGYDKPIIENLDVNAIAADATPARQ